METKEISFKVELLKTEFKYKKNSYNLNLKPGDSKVISLGDGKIAIIRRLNDGPIRWIITNETIQFGEI